MIWKKLKRQRVSMKAQAQMWKKVVVETAVHEARHFHLILK